MYTNIIHTDTGRTVNGSTLMKCGKLGGKWGSAVVATCPKCRED